MTVSYKNTIKSILAIEAGYAAHQVKIAELEKNRETEVEAETETFISTIGGFQDLCVDVVKHMGKFQKDAASELTVPDQKFEHFCSFFGKNVKAENIRRPLKTWLTKLGNDPETLKEILEDESVDLASPESIYKELNKRTREEADPMQELAKIAKRFFEFGNAQGIDGFNLRTMLENTAAELSIDDSFWLGTEKQEDNKIVFKNVA